MLTFGPPYVDSLKGLEKYRQISIHAAQSFLKSINPYSRNRFKILIACFMMSQKNFVFRGPGTPLRYVMF